MINVWLKVKPIHLTWHLLSLWYISKGKEFIRSHWGERMPCQTVPSPLLFSLHGSGVFRRGESVSECVCRWWGRFDSWFYVTAKLKACTRQRVTAVLQQNQFAFLHTRLKWFIWRIYCCCCLMKLGCMQISKNLFLCSIVLFILLGVGWLLFTKTRVRKV